MCCILYIYIYYALHISRLYLDIQYTYHRFPSSFVIIYMRYGILIILCFVMKNQFSKKKAYRTSERSNTYHLYSISRDIYDLNSIVRVLHR